MRFKLNDKEILAIIKKITVFVKSIREIKNWQVPLFAYLGFVKKESIVHFKNGLCCIIRNKSDAIAFYENFFMNINLPDKDFKINREDIIIDVGAHVGYFSLYASKNASNGKIIAIEPNKKSFETLEKNIKLNNLKNINTINSAVSNTTGKILFFSKEGDEISSSIFNLSNETGEEVNTIRLEDVFEEFNLEKINFLKMDCEGAEFQIILNLDDVSISKIEKMSIEVHENIKNCSKNSLIDFLKSKNFKIASSSLKKSSKLSMLYACKN